MYKLTPIWSLAATLAYTERAPTFYELYANGAHAATGTYEVGDADASKEKAVSTDLALRFDSGGHKGSVGVFYSRFSNYIGLLASGRYRDEEGAVVDAGDDEALPEYLYSGVRPTSTASRRRTASTCWTAPTAASIWNCPATTPAPRTRTPAKRCRASPRCA